VVLGDPVVAHRPGGRRQDEDGAKTVTVDFGDGTTHARDTATTSLDREAPVLTSATFRVDGDTWVASVVDAQGSMVSEARYSLNSTTWTGWGLATSVDLWPLAGTGAWVDGDHTMWMQTRDPAGNVSEPVAGPATIDNPAFDGWTEGPVAVEFEFPHLPVTGRLFTIRPVYPAGYVLPADAWCEWQLHWGDDQSIMDLPNPTWGELIFERPKSSGACTEWTFTLPYTTARQIHWQFQLLRKDPGQDGASPRRAVLERQRRGPHHPGRDGITDPRITTSSPRSPTSCPRPRSPAGDPVTYRLHVAGTTTVPRPACSGRTRSTATSIPNGARRAGPPSRTPQLQRAVGHGLTGTMRGGYMRSQYDPIVDGRAPERRGAQRVDPRLDVRSLVPATVTGPRPTRAAGLPVPSR
jgi:hypothetical protein